MIHALQSLSDQGNLSNLTAFVNNAVLFILAATHVINLTRSALTGNAGERRSPLKALHPFLCMPIIPACNDHPADTLVLDWTRTGYLLHILA